MADTKVEVDGDLQYYFNRTASAVGKSAEHVEEEFIRPSVNAASGYAKEKPLLSTFLAIFAALSVVPVIIFLGGSVFVFALFISSALVLAFVFSLAIILIFGSILVVTLFGAFFLAIFLTVSTIALFLGYRLITLVRADPEGTLHGVHAWLGETKGLILDRLPASYRPRYSTNQNTAASPATAAGVAGYDSEGSGVVVKTEDAPVQAISVESQLQGNGDPLVDA